jgi:hypothetical protein
MSGAMSMMRNKRDLMHDGHSEPWYFSDRMISMGDARLCFPRTTGEPCFAEEGENPIPLVVSNDGPAQYCE